VCENSEILWRDGVRFNWYKGQRYGTYAIDDVKRVLIERHNKSDVKNSSDRVAECR
jgi:hypothetical protein